MMNTIAELDKIKDPLEMRVMLYFRKEKFLNGPRKGLEFLLKGGVAANQIIIQFLLTIIEI